MENDMLEIKCKLCGTILDWKFGDNEESIIVEPCFNCLQDEYNDGVNWAESQQED